MFGNLQSRDGATAELGQNAADGPHHRLPRRRALAG